MSSYLSYWCIFSWVKFQYRYFLGGGGGNRDGGGGFDRNRGGQDRNQRDNKVWYQLTFFGNTVKPENQNPTSLNFWQIKRKRKRNQTKWDMETFMDKL